jgi:predicted transcriptional regulator
MTKESTMTFRVEEDLRERFAAAAKDSHRPAAQVLRELMRAYVERTPARPAPAAGLISDAERRRRQAAVDFAQASVGLEGFKISPEEEAHAQRYIDGDIDLEEYVRPDVL